MTKGLDFGDALGDVLGDGLGLFLVRSPFGGTLCARFDF